MQSLGLVALAIMLFATTFVLRRVTIGKHRSISQHVADEHFTFVFFGLATTLATSLMLLFIYNWLAPHLAFDWLVLKIWTLGALLQLASSWTRERSRDLESRIHLWLAYGFAFCMPIGLGFTLASPLLALEAKAFIAGLIVIMAAQFALYLTTEHVKRNYLIYQISYLMCYALGILVLTLN